MTIRRTQRERILDILRAQKGAPVPSPVLARISLQYGARILELREMGYIIRNEIKRVDGQVHGSFTLEVEPSLAVTETIQVGSPSPELFPISERMPSMLDHELGRSRGGR